MRKGRFAGLSRDPGREAGAGVPIVAPLLAAPLLPAIAALAGAPAWAAAAAAGAGLALALLAFHLVRSRSAAPVQTPDAGLLAAFEESGGGWLWRTDADGRISYVSQPLAEVLGREPGDLAGRRFDELLLVERAGAGERPALGFHLGARFPFSGVIVSPNGRPDRIWSLSGRPEFDEVGRFLGFRGVALSAGEGASAERRSDRLAASDSLTGLPNRAAMRAMLDEALTNAASRKEGCALLLMDLDRFKQVNDTLGHPIGDLLLQEVAKRIAAVIGENGKAGRLGGDEFEAVLPGIDEEGRLAALAERLIGQVSAPYLVRGHAITIGASLGIAISRPGKTYAEALVKEADLALYAAKRAGRGTFRFFEPEMHAEASDRLILENDLRSAVAKGQFRLAFQPIVSAASEDLVGFEALLRWAHPVRGPLAPADFLPLAEASGLAAGIGDWVLRTACAEAARWPRHLRVSVNVCPSELDQPGLASRVAGALASAQIDPERLDIEFPETALLAQSPETGAALAALKGLGVGLALDDFGTAPSSLISLKRAPLDRIKIDPAAIRSALPDGSRGQAMLAALIGLARALDMEVAAEGAETLDELALIRRLGFGEVQGFLFGRPMSAEEALALAAESRPVSACEATQSRPPRHSLLRRATLGCGGERMPVRLRNVSAGGAMIECDRDLAAGDVVELNLGDGVQLRSEIRWSQDGRIGLAFAEPFDLQRLGKAVRGGQVPLLRPDYLKSETSPDSPWAGRTDRLTIKDVRNR